MLKKYIPIVVLIVWGQFSFAQRYTSSNYYSDIGLFVNHYAEVRQNDKCGFINTKEELVVPCIYDDANYGDLSPCFDYGVVPVKKNGHWGVIDSTGKVIVPFNYNKISTFWDNGISVLTKDKKQGCINYKGETVVPFIYDDIWDVSEGIRQVKYNGKIGYIDSIGKQIIECKYDEGLRCGEGLIPILKGSKWGYINKKDSVIIPFMYERAYPFNKGIARVLHNGEDEYIDKKNGAILPRYAGEPVNGCFIVEKELTGGGLRYALFDSNNKAITDFDYNFISDDGHNKFSVEKDEKHGVIDNKGNIVVPIIYDDFIWDGICNRYGTIKDKKIIYLDSAGKIAIPKFFDTKYIDDFGLSFMFLDTVAVVPYHSSRRIINRKGQFTDHFKGTQTVKLYYENGVLGTTGKLKDYYKEGKWTFCYENGKLEEVINYRHGLKNGEYKNWDSAGVLQKDGIYKNDSLVKTVFEVKNNFYGVLDGVYSPEKLPDTAYFPNGKIKFMGKHDPERLYHRVGKWIEGDTDKNNNYYYAEGNYVEGNKEGEWKHYDGKGKLLFTENYKNDMQQYPDGEAVIYNYNGSVSEKGQMLNNNKEGLWIDYRYDGDISSETEYCLNEPSGVSKEYFDNGKLRSVQHYVLITEKIDSTYKIIKQRQDYKHDSGYLSSIYCGTWAEYYENGQVKDSGSYGLKKAGNDTSIHFMHRYSLSIDTVLRRYAFMWSIRVGNWAEYYENGKIKSIGKYYPAEIIVEDRDTLQDENGNPKIVICEHPIYLKDSTWKYYSESGELTREEFYDKTKLVKVKEYSK